MKAKLSVITCDKCGRPMKLGQRILIWDCSQHPSDSSLYELS